MIHVYTPTEKLDYMLWILSAQPQGKLLDESSILQQTEKTTIIQKQEVLEILNKLYADGFVDFDDQYSKSQGLLESEPHAVLARRYRLNFDGRDFISNNGYKQKRSKERASLRKAQFLNFLLGLGAFMATVYYGYELWDTWLKYVICFN